MMTPDQFQISPMRRLKNRAAMAVLCVLTLMALIPLIHVLHYVYRQGLPHWNLAFFTELPRPVGETGGGLGNAVVGSIALVSLAAAVGVPFGILVGIYLAEYERSRLSSLVRTTIELLSGVPSIVLGIFAYSAIVVPFGHFSMLAGSFALAVILLPVVAKTTEEVLKLIPAHIREAGLALGLPRWKVTIRIVLVAARSGITTGVALALARVAGETAPLLFTALSSQ
ncbi:phosphate ABC transporter permease PstA, partial [bacterium]